MLDRWCTRYEDVGMRATRDRRMTLVTVAAAEPLRLAPVGSFPAGATSTPSRRVCHIRSRP